MSYSGIGAVRNRRRSMRGMGCGYGCSGLGATGISFNAASVWAGWKACSGGSQAQCKAAVDTIRGALGQLGYGALALGTPWTSSDIAAWKAWQSDNGLTPLTAIPWKDHLNVMEAQMKAGKVTGGEEPIVYTTIAGGQVAKAETVGEGKQGLSRNMMIGIAAVAGVGLLAIVASKKKPARATV